ncbi:ROK family protein [Gallalistipes aquisgranensis]|uniref:ROK family protein n=1 Tax=Gallalistipes aquisgranensis TaxID=2779358 RepID=UPI001CF86394|nr:ROK family protein [Gallalistipes aquisgranensis]MBE5032827.1 ROK family protein [Gallalistipes aquisgranensis]
MYRNDNRTVVTLDAGGTNFVFGAIRGNEFVVDPITLPSLSDNLDTCMGNLERGFRMVIDRLPDKPVAISFAFPGPADYPNGIVGGYLPNFPSFRDGVAIGPFLEETFGIPVFINNDADLYAYGEALAGALPSINAQLEAAGSAKRYKNLIGYTFGTGFGFGFVADGKLHIGDNSCVETFCLRNKKHPDFLVEDGASIRAVKRVYGELTGNPDHVLEPREICEIADGTRPGDRLAAITAFEEMGEIAGDAIATAATLIDAPIVIGGGLIGARKYIFPALLREMRGKIYAMSGDILNRVQMKIYDLDDPAEFDRFAKGASRELKVYGSDRTVIYDPEKRIGITTSKIGTSRAISLGAYAFALNRIDEGK